MDQVSECGAFNAFIDERLAGDLSGITLEEALSKFRAYQRQLSEVKEKLKTAEEQSSRGGVQRPGRCGFLGSG